MKKVNHQNKLLTNRKRQASTKSKGSRKTKTVAIPASNVHGITHQPPPEAQAQVSSFYRWIDGGAVYPQTSAVGTSYVFKLSLIPGYTEIQNMYDFYRIKKIDVLYAPASRAGPTAATTTAPGTVIAVGPDYDESVAVSFATMLERTTTQVYSVLEKWEFTFVPRVSSVVYGNGVTSGYALGNKDVWVDTAADVSYYGVNYAFPATAAAMQFGGRIMYRLHLECAQVI